MPKTQPVGHLTHTNCVQLPLFTHKHKYTQINTHIHTQTFLPHTVGERRRTTAALIVLLSLCLLGMINQWSYRSYILL